MLLSRENVRDNIRNREGKRVFYLGKEDLLTCEARDYLAEQRIEILPASEAKPQHYVLEDGTVLEEKPEHMTHLHGNVLVPKTHPRIAFRGAVDALEAELLIAVSMSGEPEKLQEILAYTRKLIRWEVLGEPAESIHLLGLSQQEIRERSHRPEKFYGQPHFMPSGRESPLLLQINRARCAARHMELAAAAAFSEGSRPDLLQAANRLSSVLYLLMIELKSKE